MKAIIRPSVLKGTFESKPSKSMMQRAFALSLMHQGITRIQNFGQSADDLAAQQIITSCGALIQQEGDVLIIHSKGLNAAPAVLNCGESGLSLRLFSILLSVLPQQIEYVGSGTLNNRSMMPLVNILHQLGVKVMTNDGKLPLKICGPLQSQSISFKSGESSQYLTGLLFALAVAANKEVVLKVTDLVSKGYVDMSVGMLQQFGYAVAQHEEQFVITPRSLPYQDMNIRIDGDWSGAAFFLVWGALHGGVIVTGLQEGAEQPDRRIMDVLSQCGARFHNQGDNIIFQMPDVLKPFTFEATHCPDLFPPLAVLAAGINGQSAIQGVSRLYNKESNRAEALVTEFGKMDVDIHIQGDIMYIHGGKRIKGAEVFSHHDHRMAMALAMLALEADQASIIQHAEAVAKSFPDFFETLQMMGADVSLTNIDKA